MALESDRTDENPGNGRVLCTGLVNWKRGGCRNVCYMNSVLQAVAHTAPLRKYLISGESDQRLSECNYSANEDDVKGWVSLQTALLVRQMWSNKFTILDNTPVKKMVEIFKPMFKGNEQQDAQELLNLLFERLHQDLITPFDTCQPQEPDPMAPLEEQALYFEMLDNDAYHSIMHELFFFTSITTRVCMWGECHQSRYLFQTDSILILPLDDFKDSRRPVPLAAVLAPMFQEGITESELDCGICSHKTGFQPVFFALWTAPQILVIMFNRFSFSRTTGQPIKIGITVTYPLNGLDMSPYVHVLNPQEAIYDLYAVVLHDGPSANQGHYFTYARDSGDPNGQDWREFNDELVIDIEPSKVVSKMAYFLMYKRRST